MTFKDILAVFRRFFSDEAPQNSLRDNAQKLLRGLETDREATAFAVARAEEAYNDLAAELASHQNFGAQAKAFLREGDEPAARRCLEKQLASQARVTQLTAKYEQLKAQSDQKVAEFGNTKAEVMRRVEKLPDLEREAHAIQLGERVERARREFDLASPMTAFDAAERTLQIHGSEQRVRGALSADPNAATDRRIAAASEQRTLDSAFEALRKSISDGDGVLDAEIVDEPDAVTRAQRLLTASPVDALIIPATSRVEAPVRKR